MDLTESKHPTLRPAKPEDVAALACLYTQLTQDPKVRVLPDHLAADCSKILLTSSAARTEAHRFFEACGFSGTAKRGFVKYRRHFAGAPAHA